MFLQIFACYILLPHINDDQLVIGVPVYGALLLSMVWCAICRAETSIQMISAVSAAMFAISDLIIVVNLFYYPMVHSQVIRINELHLKYSITKRPVFHKI
jgi:uncharacterized membrane protein YhhN